MEYIIRPIEVTEYPVLEDFLYQAVFIPEGVKPPPKHIIQEEALQVYIKDFGEYPDDRCLVAVVDKEIVGAVWTRIMNDYGHIDDETPSLAISLYKMYRKKGIGTELMKRMLAVLSEAAYDRVSLAVQKANFAVKMYQNVGFEIIDQTEDEYIMVYNFRR